MQRIQRMKRVTLATLAFTLATGFAVAVGGQETATPPPAPVATDDDALEPAPPVTDVDTDTDVDVDVQDDPNSVVPDVDVNERTKAEPDYAETNADADVDADAEVDAEVDADVTTDADTDALPRTASPIGLLALLGAGSLGSGFALRRMRR